MRRRTARFASGLATRLSRPALIAFLAIATLAVPLAGHAGGSPDDPPPIPTPEAREAFIRAHEAGLQPWSEDPLRAVHDEYDVIHYDVDLRFDIPARTIYGVVTVDATSKVANLLVFPIDLYSPMVVDSVRVDGTPTTFTHASSVIRVNLPHALQPEDPVTLRITYHGRPSYTGTPFRWTTHGASIPMVLSYSEPYGAPAWWVCKDDPKDKATFAIHVTAPDTLSTVSNGILTSVVINGNGTATYNWTHDYPMSTYLFSIATTDFEHWTEVYTALDSSTTMDVDYYVYPGGPRRRRDRLEPKHPDDGVLREHLRRVPVPAREVRDRRVPAPGRDGAPDGDEHGLRVDHRDQRQRLSRRARTVPHVGRRHDHDAPVEPRLDQGGVRDATARRSTSRTSTAKTTTTSTWRA